jgi:hypothetical protein
MSGPELGESEQSSLIYIKSLLKVVEREKMLGNRI